MIVVMNSTGIDKKTGLITDISPINEPIKSNKMDKTPKKNKNRGRVATIILAGASSILFIISAAFITMWFLDNYGIEKLQNDFSETEEVDGGELVNPPENQDDDYWNFINMPLINVNFDDLLQRNADTVGWINVPSTNINYPVVQTNDNDYYLTHAFDKSYNGAGWIYADYRNNMVDFDANTIIYGHSRVEGTMFGTLKSALSDNWFNNKDNHVIRFSTPYKNTMWQVYSVYKTSIDFDYLITQFSSEDSYARYLDDTKSRSTHIFSAKPNVKDKIITISTCANNIENERIVLHARLIKEQIR